MIGLLERLVKACSEINTWEWLAWQGRSDFLSDRLYLKCRAWRRIGPERDKRGAAIELTEELAEQWLQDGEVLRVIVDLLVQHADGVGEGAMYPVYVIEETNGRDQHGLDMQLIT